VTRPGEQATRGSSAVDAVVSHFFRQNPGFARRAGRHEADGLLPKVEARAAGDLARLSGAVGAALDADPADRELRADLDAARHMVAAEQFQRVVLGHPYLTTPEVFAELDVSCYLRDYAPAAERGAALAEHLRAVPEFLAEATRTLAARLPAAERLRGLESARGAAAQMVAAADQLGGAPELVDQAVTACEGYGRSVHATAPAAGLWGPDRLVEFLRVVEGLTWPVPELLSRARAAVSAAQQRLDALAGELGVAGRREVLALPAGVMHGERAAALAEILERIRDFWVAADVVTIDTATPLTVAVAAGRRSAVTVEFQVAAPLERPRPPHVLYLPDLSGAPADAVGTFLNDAMLEVLAVHEAYPGHYVHAEAGAAGGSVIRTCFSWIDGLTEGWAHYAEQLAVDHGLADGRPLLEVAQQRSALESATRLVAFLTMHGKQTGFGAAVAEAAAASGWSDERAAHEVLAVTSNPQGAMYALGKIVIQDWRDGAGPDRKTFHEQLLRCGTAPLSTARRYWQEHTTLSVSSYSEAS
jgi:hypothetical protein